MNYLVAEVSGIQNVENLHIVEFKIETDFLYMISLEVPNIKKGLMVRLSIKPMNIAIAKRFSGSISFSNKLFATIKEIKKGELLSSVKFDFKGKELESIVTNRATENMHLKVNDTVVLFVKASDIFVKEVL